MTEDKFFSLLRFSIDDSEPIPANITKEDWKAIYEISIQQALMGVVFRGINRMPSDLQPEKELMLRWFAISEYIAGRNKFANEKLSHLTIRMRYDRFRICVLKGQGNTLYYPDAYMRTPGDIDAWLCGSVDRIVGYAHKIMPDAIASYQHVGYPRFYGIPVELHYRPSFQFNFVHNARLQRWFKDNAERQFANKVMLPGGFGPVSIPTVRFNRVFQMSHIARHLFHEGIGLRQIMDYYFLLKQGFTEEERLEYAVLMKSFGLYKMARSVMYVLREEFGAGDDVLIVEPDERCGRLLLEEIMLTGNFGHYDGRLTTDIRKSRWKMNMYRCKRVWRLLKFFPSESLSEPLFQIYHHFWRVVKNRDGLKPQ